MTNYNDGKWHGWNDGECPVHHDSEVEVAFSSPARYKKTTGPAKTFFNMNGTFAGCVAAFRVIKEHKEPREWWVWDCRLFLSESDAMNAYICDTSKYPMLNGKSKPCKVREVLE